MHDSANDKASANDTASSNDRANAISTHESSTSKRSTQDKARTLLELHQRQDLLILPNAWDATSARLFAELPGVSALATTSAGIAAAAGYPDGELLDVDCMLSALRRTCAAVDVPVSADLESGYGDVERSVNGAINAGCAGINLEDGQPGGTVDDAAWHAGRIAAAREVAAQHDVPLVINARSDVFWLSVGTPENRLRESISRLRRYREAGADCVFLPGFPCAATASPEADVRALVDAMEDTPVNLLLTPSSPDTDVLASWGVRRLTVGSGLYRLALSSARQAAFHLISDGCPSALRDAAELPYSRLSQLLG